MRATSPRPLSAERCRDVARAERSRCCYALAAFAVSGVASIASTAYLSSAWRPCGNTRVVLERGMPGYPAKRLLCGSAAKSKAGGVRYEAQSRAKDAQPDVSFNVVGLRRKSPSSLPRARKSTPRGGLSAAARALRGPGGEKYSKFDFRSSCKQQVFATRSRFCCRPLRAGAGVPNSAHHSARQEPARQPTRQTAN